MAPQPLLSASDPPVFELCHPTGAASVLLSCDHASRIVPAALDRLGLTDVVLAQHIGWDIGAAAVTRLLAPMLDAPAVLAGYSRLVIDCNRPPDDPSSIPSESDGIAIPGNAALDAAARQARVGALFEPYHAAIDAQLSRIGSGGRAPAVISVHSFTPRMKGFARPWHIGVLWDGEGRIATPLLAALRAELGPDAVGDNQPYSAREPVGYTQRHHAFDRGFSHVAIELRQDLIADDKGAAEWAERLARLLKPILAPPGLYVAIDRPGTHT
ncbi:MAG TPA: N-formylglutamate amidohydrolase [Stellaceae bacterium]|jgi:predicted N-formylglutamate amidohydrolase|nr:N-formylglutamate amidohydrolase [Stellaceae bacterium]